MTTFPSRTLSVTINRAWTEVYDYASDPANLTHWAVGLGTAFEHAGDDWTFRTPGGEPVKMRFTEQNALGVLDHDVILADRTVHVPLRVMPNGDGAEVSFLLLQTPDLSDADLERDAAAVRADLSTLKRLLESQ